MDVDNLEEQTETATSSQNKTSTSEEERSSRMGAAKAFFRAMYAGETSPAAEPGSGIDEKVQQALEAAVQDLEQKASDAENLYKRMAADFDNYRRRMERERDEFLNSGVRKAVEAFLPALDDLDRAMTYLNADTPAEKILESFQLVASRIFSCLESLGIKRMVTEGSVFDPRFHEPVQQIETTEHPDGSILSELRGGYMLGERVIRPALVNVASNESCPSEDVLPAPQELSQELSKDESCQVDKSGVYDLGDMEDFQD